jgi:biotin carboxylase
VAETVPFRDKEVMKRRLDDAGIRTPRHRRADTPDEVRAAAKAVGYPLIVKPIAGAGSADTHRVDDDAELERVLALVRHVPVVSVEEFIEGEEFTFDTVCANGEILYENVAWYRPRPLIGRTNQWISPQTISLRRIDDERIAGGRAMGRAVLGALGFREGFTHMEWFRKPDGEAVFGEIGCRPPGAKSVDIMNFASDVDLFTGWAEAVTHGRFTQPVRRRFNAAVVFKRAEGEGRITGVHGLDGLLSQYGPHVTGIDLLPPGAPRRNWKQTLLSDGWVFLRHPDLQVLCHMADEFGLRLRMTAG